MSIWDSECQELNSKISLLEGRSADFLEDAEAIKLMKKFKMQAKPNDSGDGSWWEVFCPCSYPQHHKGPSLNMAICRAAADVLILNIGVQNPGNQ